VTSGDLDDSRLPPDDLDLPPVPPDIFREFDVVGITEAAVLVDEPDADDAPDD
jgi:hypothetical protein